MSEKSYIGINRQSGKCQSFVGPDAVEYVRLECLASALSLYATSKILVDHRLKISDLLKQANDATGCVFRRGQYAEASAAVRDKAQQLKAALPKMYNF